MLDFRRTHQPITQGQPLATMTLATLPASDTTQTVADAAMENSAPSAVDVATADGIDAHALARLVYALLQQELRSERSRRGQ